MTPFRFPSHICFINSVPYEKYILFDILSILKIYAGQAGFRDLGFGFRPALASPLSELYALRALYFLSELYALRALYSPTRRAAVYEPEAEQEAGL
jgi:hypothetical protein